MYKESNKKRIRKSRNAIIYITIAVLLVLLLALLGANVFMRITEIEIIGTSFYTEDEIVSASGVSLGDSLLFLSGANMSRRIQEELTYISDVQSSSVFPGTLRIYVSESTPIAQIRYRGEFVAIDASGRIQSHTDSTYEGAINVLGVTPVNPEVGNVLESTTNTEANLAVLKVALSAIETAGISDDISQLDVSNAANISFNTIFADDGYEWHFTVELGSLEDIYNRIRPLPGVFQRLIEENPEGAVGRIRFQPEQEQWIFTI